VPVVIEDVINGWAYPPGSQPVGGNGAEIFDSHGILIDTVATLRERHAKNRDKFRERVAALARERERCERIRRQVARDRLTRQASRSPSS
jgi:hypothetical protein